MFTEKMNINCLYVSYLYKITIQSIYIYRIIRSGTFYKKLIYDIQVDHDDFLCMENCFNQNIRKINQLINIDFQLQLIVSAFWNKNFNI